MLTTDEVGRLTAWVRKPEQPLTREQKVADALTFLAQIAPRHPEWRVRRLPR